MATNPTAVSPQGAAKQAVRSAWGMKGVSERFYVQENSIAETPTNNAQQIILSDAGILEELQHHHYGTYTFGGGTVNKDAFGPYSAINQYQMFASSNTPLVSLSGPRIGILQTLEYPDKSFETSATPASVENALTNASDYFNYPSTTGPMRLWFRIPTAIKVMGFPGGYVAHTILQNKRIANVIKPTFNLYGNSAPYNAYEGTSSSGAGAYSASGSGSNTVTAAPNFETWKTLYTVPASAANMPIFGFTRYINEVIQPYSGSSFTYNFEPGGELMRAVFQFVDATAGTGSTPAGMATSNLNQIAYQYGTNKQLDVYTPYRNIHQQLLDYGRVLPQGCFVFDYYTPWRTLNNTKSTENTANVQVIAQFASGYSVPANSQVVVLLDKVYAIQNYLGK